MDYYPYIGTRIKDPLLKLKDGGVYFPGAGFGRAKTITRNWGTYQFATVYATNAETGGVDGDPGGGLTEQQFRDNPPPLCSVEFNTTGPVRCVRAGPLDVGELPEDPCQKAYHGRGGKS